MDKTKQAGKPQKAGGLRGRNDVLIIHGHDKLNLLLLKELLRDHLHLKFVLLNDRPGLGRTIIEMFEQDAADAGFAIVLMTPDDLVEFGKKRYRQARPNVHIELGWAFCYFGRSNVCLLVMKGTDMPSNLHGIHRIDFNESIEEVAYKLQSELESAGIKPRRRPRPTPPRISH
jgi:predicted nucleotide-binding protein